MCTPELPHGEGRAAGRQRDRPCGGLDLGLRQNLDAGRPAIDGRMMQAGAVVAVRHKWAGSQIHEQLHTVRMPAGPCMNERLRVYLH